MQLYQFVCGEAGGLELGFVYFKVGSGISILRVVKSLECLYYY